MKALTEKHIQALELRKKGWSYSAIKTKLGIAKSTASAWLNEYPLSHDQLAKLQFNNEHRIEAYRETMAKKKQALLNNSIAEQEQIIGNLTEQELYVAGLALYWGEGGKTRYSTLTFANTDPRMIKFFLTWLLKAMHYPFDRIRIKMQLYKDMSIVDEMRYWQRVTGLGADQFKRPYIKETTLRGLTYKNRGHGTCNIIASGLKFARPVFAGMELLARMY